MSNPEKQCQETNNNTPKNLKNGTAEYKNNTYTFKICGIDKEISLQLSGETSIQQILAQLSNFTSIKSESLQIRNGTQALSDINKTLSQYIIEDPTNFLVLRDDVLDNKTDSKESESQSESDSESVEQAIQLHSNDGSIDFINQISQIKSPILPSVPPNSYASNNNSNSNIQIALNKGKNNNQSQGLYNALEALSNNQNDKKLNSLSQHKKK